MMGGVEERKSCSRRCETAILDISMLSAASRNVMRAEVRGFSARPSAD